jgi:ABC-type transport system involved in multi-copper enzyme maturation permease subunit
MARWGPGPVFAYECAAAARRWQTYAGRAAFLAVLLVSLAVVWAAKVAPDPAGATLSNLALVGESFFYAIAGTQLVLVLLAAPAYTAGAVCLDKARGTLTHVLVTDLSSAEIAFGKLGSRLLPVLGLVIAGLPILALATLLGGIDPAALFGSFLVTLGVAIAGCALALLLSVWGNKPHEVLLATYLVLAVLLLAWPAWHLLPLGWGFGAPPAWLERSNPFWLAFAPYLRAGSVGPDDYLVFLGACLGLAALMALLATATLRRAAAREPARRTRRRSLLLWWLQRWLPRLGPSLDFNPVLWREWFGRRPSRWVRAVWVAYVLLSLAASGAVLATHGAPMGGDTAPLVNAFQYSIGLLLVSITSVTSLFEERVRGSLDVLLTTPLPTSRIVWGKWWGAFRGAALVMLLPLGLAMALGLVKSWPQVTRSEWALAQAWECAGSLVLLLILPYVVAGTCLGLAWITGDKAEIWPRWWGWFRSALIVFPLGLVIAIGLGLMEEGRSGRVFLLTGLMLAYGAAVTSLGLALATWVKRFGFAVGLSAAIYLLVTVGAALVLLALGSGEDDFAYASPWIGAGELTYEIGGPAVSVREDGWKIVWGVFYAAVAIVLALATWRTFDRCMGRVTDRPFRKPRYYVRRR